MASIEYVVNAVDNASGTFRRISLSTDSLKRQLDDLSRKVATPTIDVNDKQAQLKLAEAATRINRLSDQVAKPKVELDTVKFQRDILRVEAELDKLGAKTVEVGKISGLDRILANAPGGAGIGALIDKFTKGYSGAGGSGFWGFFKNLFSGFSGAAGGGVPGAIAGSAGLLGTVGPTGAALGVSVLGPLAGLIESILPFGLGTGLGGVGAYLTGGTKGLTQALAVIKQQVAPLKPLFDSVFGELPKLAKQIGPGLRDVFAESVPFLKSFVGFLGQAAKILLPAFSQVLRQMIPFLPMMDRGLLAIVAGFAEFFKALGPQGMKIGAEVFIAVAKTIEILLEGLGKAINFLAVAFGVQVKIIAKVWDWMYQQLSGVVKHMVAGWDTFRHDTASVFDFIRGYLAGWWKFVYNNTFAAVIHVVSRDIPAAFDATRRFMEAWALRLEILFAGWAKNILHYASDAFSWLPGWLPGVSGIKKGLASAEADLAHFVSSTQNQLHQLTDKHYSLTFGLNLPKGVSYPSRPIKGRASGGGVSAGEWAMVGERGPELAYFAAGGHVIPNHAIKGYAEGSGAVTVHLSTPSLQAVGSMLNGVAQAIVSTVRSSAQVSAAMLGAGGRTSAGGQYNLGMLENLWQQAGGPGGYIARIAAAIALAESGGNPNAFNPSGATGLWQILGSVIPGNLRNPFINALNAVKKYDDARGFSPWVTYETGAYRAFMDRGGWLPPGRTLVTNNTGRPERVLAPGQSAAVVLEYHGQRGGLEQALWDFMLKQVRVKGGGDVQAALGSA